MTRLEVEYFTVAASVTTARAEYLAALVCADEEKLLGLGDSEGLTIHFLAVNVDSFGNACRNRVSRIDIPENFFLFSGKVFPL